MFGYEDELRHKIEKLEEQNKKLRDVADAVRKYVDLYEIEKTKSGRYVIETLEALDE